MNNYATKVQKSRKISKNIEAKMQNFADCRHFCTFAADLSMRRIEYILPVASVHGSICPRQEVKYTENETNAWSAPDGLQTAVGYKPIIVCQRRNRRNCYLVRTKTSAAVNSASRLSWAQFGGASALFGAITRSGTINRDILTIYESKPQKVMFRKWCFDILLPMLVNEETSCTFGEGNSTVTILNPWRNAGQSNVTIPADVYNKFKDYL